jgi:hypothetical protein
MRKRSTRPKGPIHSHAQLDLVIRNTCANVAIVLTKVHNMQLELQESRKELRELQDNYKAALQLILKLIEDPESRHHASAVVRDHFNTRPEKS